MGKSCVNYRENHMKIADFGVNRKGETSKLYTLENGGGMEIAVSDFGATLHSLMVLDRRGIKRDVVLGYDSPSEYEGPSGTFFGATVGRNANRIGGAAFCLNGRTYHLDQNDGRNNLHSGFDFWSFRKWEVRESTADRIVFGLHSPDGDQGFPGTVDAEVAYQLTEDNRLVISYRARTDEDTPLNLTNHSYFNLNGHDSGPVLGQTLWIDGDYFTETDEELIPTGMLLPVEGTPMDFRKEKPIGQDIRKDYPALVMGKVYDHNWCLKNQGKFAKAAVLSSADSGITMEVYTDLPGIQIYTGNYLNQEKGKKNAVYMENQGICFETQYFPDAVNHKNFPSSICRKGELYQTKTEFRFVKG